MRRGFTMVELLIVIGLIAVLSSMTLSAITSVRTAAKRHQTEAVLAKVDTAARQFRADIGFYPKSFASQAGVEYETSGFNRGLVKLDPATSLPITDNDSVWLSGLSPWRVGNGLMASLGTRMSIAEKQTAIANAEAMRKIEDERFYHIGNFGDFECTGLAKPGGWVRGTLHGTHAPSPYRDWAYVDPTGTGPVTLGERELRKIFNHFTWAPTRFNSPYGTRSNGTPPWTASPLGNETSVGTNQPWTHFQTFAVKLFQNFQVYARPRDAADAYQRALRDGVGSGTYSFDSQYDDTHTASPGAVLYSRDIDITVSSKSWRGDYLVDLESRSVRDVDGDGVMDIIDAYGNPLIYVCEGLPAAAQIFPRIASVDGNPLINTSTYDGPNRTGVLLLYHPDPDRESTNFINPNTIYSYITDKPNARGVAVRPDAFDIGFLSYGWGGVGSTWLYAEYGIDIKACGDPYLLAGTLIPSRVRVFSVPTGTRAGDLYYCLSEDGTTLIEPYMDANANKSYDAGEPFIDRNRNGSYDSTIGLYDIRLCAPSGEEREFEVLSAGRDGRFHALRPHQANMDNIKPGLRR